MGRPVGSRAGVREAGRAEGGVGGVDVRVRDEVPAERRRGFPAEREFLVDWYGNFRPWQMANLSPTITLFEETDHHLRFSCWGHL